MAHYLPSEDYVTYGPDTNCTLAVCPPSYSVYQYRPTLGGNIAFLVLFGLALIIHLVLGLKWRTYAFTFAVFWGCVSEVIGYGGRIMLYQNPFSFNGFLMQISEYHQHDNQARMRTDGRAVCITLGPTFFTAAIYLTLSKMYVWNSSRRCTGTFWRVGRALEKANMSRAITALRPKPGFKKSKSHFRTWNTTCSR